MKIHELIWPDDRVDHIARHGVEAEEVEEATPPCESRYTPVMRAIKLQTQVEKDHTLHLRLPEDVKEGPAEVIVLVPEAAEPRHTLADFLAHLSDRPRTTRNKEEIDQYLQEERASWES